MANEDATFAIPLIARSPFIVAFPLIVCDPEDASAAPSIHDFEIAVIIRA